MKSLGLGGLMLLLAAGTANAQECDQFADRLESCTAYTCTFSHPFTGASMQRTIEGLSDGVCAYSEQMPNNGRMACSFDAQMRKSIADFYRQAAAAESMGASHSASPGAGGSESESRIDGEVVVNPLQQALESGQCQVTGYGQ